MKSNTPSKSETGPVDTIIYAWDYVTWGGAQIYFLGLIKEVKKDFNVEVLLPSDSDPQLIEFFRNEGIDCTKFDAGESESSQHSISKFQLHKNKIAREKSLLNALEENFDLSRAIVHVELAPWQSLFALIWLLLRTRVFITMHNSLPSAGLLRRLLWKTKLRIVSLFPDFHVFASNEDSKNYFKGLYSNRKHNEILVTYTNVDPFEIAEAYDVEIDRPALRAKHGLKESDFLVFCVGQFIDRKGRWVFLDAAAKVSAKDPSCRFVWISNSVLSDNDKRLVDSYNLGEKFVYIESKSVGEEHVDLFRFLRTADLFALVSLQEGLPISLLEAMALEIPCISTRVNAIPEAVYHRKTGWLIEAGDADALADAVIELKSDTALCKGIGTAGRELVLRKFNEKEVAAIALKAYKSAVHGS